MNIKMEQIQMNGTIRSEPDFPGDFIENIREYGIIQPVVVKSIGEDRYELISGSRRLAACKQLGWTDVLVYVINADTALKKLDIQLSENLKRKELSPIEISEAILARMKYWEEIHGTIANGGDRRSQDFKVGNGETENFIEETRKIVHMDQATIYRLIQLRELPDDLKEQVRNGTLSYRNAINKNMERKWEKSGSSGKKIKHRGKNRTLPNLESAQPFCERFAKAPNLVDLIFLSNNLWTEVVQFKQKYEIEWDQINQEYIEKVMKWCEETDQYLQYVMGEIKNRYQIKPEEQLNESPHPDPLPEGEGNNTSPPSPSPFKDSG